MRRDPAAYAAMSDPIRNREFRRGWDFPPWPEDGSRTPAPAGGQDAIGKIVSWNSADNSETLRQAQRAAAEALLDRAPA
jgi:hypothetical protein